MLHKRLHTYRLQLQPMATQPEIDGDLVLASSEQHTPSSLAESSSSIWHPNPKIEDALYRAIRGQIDDIFQSLNSRKHEDRAKFKIEAALKQLEDLEIDEHVDGTEEEEENPVVTSPQIRPELRKLVKFVMKYERFLRCFKDLDSDWVDNDDDIDHYLIIPSLPENPAATEDSTEFLLLQTIYYTLEWHLQLCLLCFSVFPENTIIKKRVMLYWWIGEGFVSTIFEKTAEEYANECLDQLIEKGLIQPIYRLHNMAMDGCKVPQFVRSAVITFAQRDNFFHFDSISIGVEGTNAAVMAQDYSDFTRACLLGKGGLSKSIQDLQILRTLFNLNQCLLEVDPKWLSNMTNVQILYLGRWQLASTFHHIEVQGTDTDFLNMWLENTNYLTFLSLQGIYGITELPAVALSKMLYLEILDLRDCYSLEVLPETISELKNLTHLDMSECYLLDHMPKGISLLLKLQVLKGFVIGGSKRKGSCNLDDLAGLKEMRKLNIRAVKNEFPTDKELNALQKFRALRKLKIEWEEGSSKASTGKLNRTLSKLRSKLHDSKPNSTIRKLPSKLHDSKPNSTISKLNLLSKLHDSKQKNKSISLVQALPAQLEKLDLHCFPHITLPKWLMPSNLKNLKKLYIRGGQLRLLQHIDQEFDHEGNVPESDKWTVEILRLKYLAELKMDWTVLQKLFPKLICSETVQCPNLSSFPCDEKGLWKAEQLN